MENKYKRIVIKVGTSSITYPTGKINLGRMEELAKIVSDLKNRGYEIVLVSSGAIGAGVGKMGLDDKPVDTKHKQALAAIGQASLVSMYDRFFSNFGYSSAQVLLTKYVFDDEEKYNNAHNAFEIMFGYGVIPIVNENDVISIDEIEVGDNDSLSAYVGKMVNAD
ncbi:MAG: glutamate 5-kinase, partial [Clostridia bacterium]|nr:glutamate 5-kinase [Clostridia bacterium]